MTIHADWLSLIEVSGAFLAEPVLDSAFPQGLEGFPTHKRRTFRQTYEEWREAQDNSDELKDQLHIEWINWVLRVGLEWDEDGSEEDLKSQSDLPESLSLSMPEHGLVINPDYALFGDDKSKPFVIVQTYTADTDLNKVLGSDGWSTSPAERMSHLCKATGVRLGLITNGEQWMLVDAREGNITSYATWYARLWSQEPSTLKSFYSLLNISAFFNGLGLDAKKLPDLLDESLKHQDEVTETLGSQVQRAVEVLIQSLDRINKDKNGELLKGVEPSELYEAGLTYMMRLVFLLCAEERGLLLLGDETYESNYAVSTLRMKLREEAGQHGEEVLGFRNNAWSRLLAVFRAVYGGIEHEELRMPALGGSLFDPDRFPFLEGRPKGSNWRIDEAHPLPIDNRTVLLFLDAIQLFQGRTLSYRALDVEQIGYVYEGLLEKTVIRADDVTLELNATQKSKAPWLKLGELASAELDGEAKVLALLQERTGSSASRVKNDYSKSLEPTQAAELLLACNNNTELRDRLLPYFHFLREDALGKPLIYAKNAFIVATGQDRRETGTHYTPKSLTEAVVKETLEPLVYEGPSIGTPREDWRLKTAEELLDLKVCDPAMGSGAFLVQVVRYLGERVCEAWEQAETDGKAVSVEGVVIEASAGEELLPPQTETEARNLIARRLVAERCIYGVDVNPLAVELAKLSIWLVTLSKGRPFGFLDHNFRSGDSLIGLQNLDQLLEFALHPKSQIQKRLFSQHIATAVSEAIELRTRIRSTKINDIRDVTTIFSLNEEATGSLKLAELFADAFIGTLFENGGKERGLSAQLDSLAITASKAVSGDTEAIRLLQRIAKIGLSVDLNTDSPVRKPLHWCLAFPEVFEGGGFSAVLGNPPFIGGKKIKASLGSTTRNYIAECFSPTQKGSSDLVAYFFILANRICQPVDSTWGLIATNTISEGDTREVGLDQITKTGTVIYSAFKSLEWPGTAAVSVSIVFGYTGSWTGERKLNGEPVESISTMLSDRAYWQPLVLSENSGKSFVGSLILGTGFLVTPTEAENLIKKNPDFSKVLFPYFNGQDLNTNINQDASRWVINFWDWPLRTAERVKELPVAEDFGELLDIVYKKVKPDRDKNSRRTYREYWWQFGEKQKSLYKAIGRADRFYDSLNNAETLLEKVIVIPETTKYCIFSMVSTESVLSHMLKVIASDSYSMLAILNSTFHDAWARLYSSSMGSTMRYSPTDCFQNFPLPEMMEHAQDLSRLGGRLEDARRVARGNLNIGNTKLYNLVHSMDADQPEIAELRSIHNLIDEAVLNIYGWHDVELNFDFYKNPTLPPNDSIRFGPEIDVTAEVLYRLAMLNKKRYEDETRSIQQEQLSISVSKRRVEAEKKPETKQIDFRFTQDLHDESSTNELPFDTTGNAWGSKAIDQILAWLDANHDWYSKAAVLAGCGADESRWDSSIRELLRDGDIEAREIEGVMRYRAVE